VGPAIVEDGGSSYVLRAAHSLSVDRIGNAFITVTPQEKSQKRVA